ENYNAINQYCLLHLSNDKPIFVLFSYTDITVHWRINSTLTFLDSYSIFLFILLITAERMHQVQEKRKQQLNEICSDDKEALSEGKRSVDDMSDKELENLLVDDTHGIIYCYIPKVACTNWKRVMFVLNQSELIVTQCPYMVALSVSPTSSLFQTAKLKHYTKFLFVRDPFVRIISAYRNKFHQSNELFYHDYARDILHLYGNQSDPPHTVDEAFALGVRPSFQNFIQYLVDPQTEKDQPFEPHWRQIHRLCHPCHIQYDFIGHQETLHEEDDIKFATSHANMTSPFSVLDWFRTVPVEDRRNLYKLYESDFRLFGYRKPD
uniref:Carbohydrate sulfotransferase n=1 Tax=Scophthalmus maximus TaxID=52904 RepID=A0A8D2ZS74_SCOMX